MDAEWKPGCPEWVHENGSLLAEEKRRRVLERLVLQEHASLPSAELVQSWHREMFSGIAPHSDYVGQFRDKQQTAYCLQDYEVIVGDIPGTPCDRVLSEVEAYFRQFNARLRVIERSFQPGSESPPRHEDVTAVVELAAWAHGEWVRIHPFANGNGRTARLLANYVLTRFGFGPVLALRPRPDQPYGEAARASMKSRDHRPMARLLWQLLEESYKK